jgi:hypothetical protein
MTQEVLKLAFEALDNLLYWDNGKPEYDEAREAITAIKEALAQTELCKYGQEPKSCTSSPMDCQCAIDAALAQPEQEPVVGITAIRTWFKDGRVVTQTLCNSWVDTTPPQRSESSGKPSAWVGLTDEEYTHITDTVFHTGQGLVAYYKAIEARLKEKNNA